MTREDLELYVSGNYDGDATALEQDIAADPALAEAVADEARFEMLLRDAASAATFCVACHDVVRGERCEACGAAVRPGGYTIERVLVSNAHGRMYVAHDADGKQVALKELAFVQAPSPAAIEAFEREARFLRALAHPAIPRFVASFEEGRGVHARYYLAQELVDGTPLDRLEQKWYREDEIVDVARQVLAILVYLQSLSPMIIHRDIKPANLIRRADGSIALVDFGAAYIDGTAAGTTTAVGTFGYMPVEQHAGIVDATTDLYALGASLLYLLTRQEPWRLQQTQITVNVSAPLRAYLDRLTAADPRQRFGSAQEALVMLDRREELVKQVIVNKPRRNLVAAALVVGGLMTAGAITAVTMHASRAHEERPVPAVPAARPGEAAANVATVRISLPRGPATLFVDDTRVAEVSDDGRFPVEPGIRKVTLVDKAGAKCEHALELPAGKTTTIECLLGEAPKAPPAPRLDNDRAVTVRFRSTPFYDVMSTLAKTCGLSVVFPDHIDPKVTAHLANTPCDEAFETILEAQGLWYELDPATKLMWIAPRRELDALRAEAMTRPPSKYAPLPRSTHAVDLDLKHAPLQDLVRMLAKEDGQKSIVIPDHIDGKTNVILKGVPWERALEAVLNASGLWYRYREEGNIVRIAPRRELQADEAGER